MPLHHQGQVTGSKDSIQSEIPLHEIPRTVKQARRRRGHRRNVERKVSTKDLQWCPTELRISHRNERPHPSPITPLKRSQFYGTLQCSRDELKLVPECSRE